MMRLVSRIDNETGETVVWCGGEDFDPITTQAQLQEAGLSLVTIRDDKWAVVDLAGKVLEENDDGRQEG
jgi:hypothetical protein